jgi:hypothetical protein
VETDSVPPPATVVIFTGSDRRAESSRLPAALRATTTAIVCPAESVTDSEPTTSTRVVRFPLRLAAASAITLVPASVSVVATVITNTHLPGPVPVHRTGTVTDVPERVGALAEGVTGGGGVVVAA